MEWPKSPSGTKGVRSVSAGRNKRGTFSPLESTQKSTIGRRFRMQRRNVDVNRDHQYGALQTNPEGEESPGAIQNQTYPATSIHNTTSKTSHHSRSISAPPVIPNQTEQVPIDDSFFTGPKMNPPLKHISIKTTNVTTYHPLAAGDKNDPSKHRDDLVDHDDGHHVNIQDYFAKYQERKKWIELDDESSLMPPSLVRNVEHRPTLQRQETTLDHSALRHMYSIRDILNPKAAKWWESDKTLDTTDSDETGDYYNVTAAQLEFPLKKDDSLKIVWLPVQPPSLEND
eukprot:scaffold77491_cov56-Attheya_sp.AAC.1